MKKQLLSLLLALGTCLPASLLAERYTEYECKYACTEGLDYEDMPDLEDTPLLKDDAQNSDNNQLSIELPRGMGYWQYPILSQFFTGHTPPPDLIFSRSNTHVAAGNADGKLHIGDLATGDRKYFEVEGGVRYLALSPVKSNVLAVVDNYGYLKTIDIRTGQAIVDFEQSEKAVIDLDDHARNNYDKAPCPRGGVVFTQDGQYIISELKQPREGNYSPGNNRFYKAPLWGIWHADTGQFIDSYHDILFDPNGNVLLDGSWCNMIQIPDTQRELKASFYAISAQNKKLAVMSHKNVHLYGLEDGIVTLQNKLPYREDGSAAGLYTAISFSADGKYLAAATNREINVWEVASAIL